MRVIFVDDEPHVLQGIQRMLAMLDKSWDAAFAQSAAEALGHMARLPADVIVSDIRMPERDGAELLKDVQQQWPGTLRVILSGQCEPEAVMRALKVAHQFIAKPCDSRLLVQSLERIVELHRLLQSDVLRALVGKIRKLPAAPSVYLKLAGSLDDEGANSNQIADLVSQDPALAAKVLHLVNSAFFGRGRPVTDIRGAVTRLGTSTLRMLVLSSEVFGSDPQSEALQRRAVLASRLVGRMTTRRDELEVAQTAALLAEVGLLIPNVAELCAMAGLQENGSAFTHVEVGAYLLGLWGLSTPIVEAVAYHAAPGTQPPFSVLGLVHVAVALAAGRDPDEQYLARCGVLERLPKWRELRDEMSQAG